MDRFCTIYVVRHGETDWNTRGIIQGHSDIALNDRGEIQAKDLGLKLKDVHFDAVFSSDLVRARRTAEIITLEKKLAVQTAKELRERSFGPYEGKHFSNIEKAKALYDLKNRAEQLEKINIETDEELLNRFIPFVRELSVTYASKKVLLVTHGGVMRWFLIHLGFGTEKTLPVGSISNLAYAKIRCDGTDFFVDETSGIRKKSD